MLTYWRVRSALKTARALPKSKIVSFESDSIPFFLSMFFLFFSSSSIGEENYYKEFDGYKVHYSVFSSTSISAEMARRYGLVRSQDRVFVNIAVVPEDKEFGGVAAKVTGSAKNLIQLESRLDFKEIKEQDAVYYLATLRHTNNEIFHFAITVDPPGSNGPFELTFTKELFTNP